uniref:(California timema) hypothetical protein n=1 Tax=Timema californicum TaxID=61474 RepID=A0A7R9P8N0_TIMCA|nr:unnamed protein product [Timema californicum]
MLPSLLDGPPAALPCVGTKLENPATNLLSPTYCMRRGVPITRLRQPPPSDRQPRLHPAIVSHLLDRLTRGVVVGAALLGVGSLTYYAFGRRFHPPTPWPPYVRRRLRSMGCYLTGSLAISCVSATVCVLSPYVREDILRGPEFNINYVGLAVFVTNIIVQYLRYHTRPILKHGAWVVHCCSVGVLVAPVFIAGPNVFCTVFMITTAVVLNLVALSLCATNTLFLRLGDPLRVSYIIFLGGVIASTFLSLGHWIRPTLDAFIRYGGLLLYSAFLLYHSQILIITCVGLPLPDEEILDPINVTLPVFQDTVNIFYKISIIVALDIISSPDTPSYFFGLIPT